MMASNTTVCWVHFYLFNFAQIMQVFKKWICCLYCSELLQNVSKFGTYRIVKKVPILNLF